MKRNTDSTLQFFDLPWNDILIKKIMVYVLPHDWLNLRIVSKRAYHLVSDYLSRIRYLDLSTCNRFPKALWKVIFFYIAQIVNASLLYFVPVTGNHKQL